MTNVRSLRGVGEMPPYRSANHSADAGVAAVESRMRQAAKRIPSKHRLTPGIPEGRSAGGVYYSRIRSCKESAMPITDINHYLVVSKNLERSKKFYEEVLGLNVAAERPDFGFPGYWLKAGETICVHLASQQPNRIRDRFLLKKHPRGTTGSGSVDHIAFLAKDPGEVRERIRKHKVEMHFRSFPEAKLFQIFLKDPDDVTIELNFLGEVIDGDEWKGKGSASALTLKKSSTKARTTIGQT